MSKRVWQATEISLGFTPFDWRLGWGCSDIIPLFAFVWIGPLCLNLQGPPKRVPE